MPLPGGGRMEIIMDIKQCPNCHKDLPKEAKFCPYCMTKLIREDGTEIQFKRKKNNKIHYILIGLMMIVIAGLTITFILIKKHRNKEVQQTSVQIKQDSYVDYLGVWFDEKPAGELNLGGYEGKRLEICRVYQNEIVINLESFAKESLVNASIEDIKVRLYDGTGSFSFTDDGCGNAGSGDITLSGGKIHVKIDLDRYYTTGHWDISMDTDFICVKKYESGQKVDISGFLTAYRTNRALFGNRTNIEHSGDLLTYTYDNGLMLEVEDTYDMDELYVTKLTVDYDMLKSDYQYMYRGIDNHSSKKEVKKMLGSKNIQEWENSYQYTDKEYDAVVEVYFDDHDMVESIIYRNGNN